MRVCALFYHPPPPPPPPHPSSLLSGWVFVFVLASLPGGGGEVGGGSVGDGRARRSRFFTPPPHKRALTQLDGSARRSRTPRLDGYRWHRSRARKIPTSPRLRKSSIIAVGSLSISISLSLCCSSIRIPDGTADTLSTTYSGPPCCWKYFYIPCTLFLFSNWAHKNKIPLPVMFSLFPSSLPHTVRAQLTHRHRCAPVFFFSFLSFFNTPSKKEESSGGGDSCGSVPPKSYAYSWACDFELLPDRWRRRDVRASEQQLRRDDEESMTISVLSPESESNVWGATQFH